MFGEKFLDPSVETALVFRTREAVTFVRIDHVGHFTFCFAQRTNYRVSISHCDSRIVFALADEKRREDGIDMVQRRERSLAVVVVIGVSCALSPALPYVSSVFG